ncbi:MAG: hypothetical protein IKF83_03015 [Clostridia bacterium]|nr:hypothetical protein [Clostridia bacterium]
MENATKALLIAAAILIAIVLVSIGVFVLRQGQDAIGSVNMSESEILAFNSKFDTYAGTQRGSSIKAMASRIWIANKELGDNADVVKLNVDGHQVTEGSDPDVVTTKYYNVTITKSPSTGLITEINVEPIE